MYRYMKKGKPLRKCPECESDLEVEDGIELGLCVGGHSFDVPSHLENGYLIDTPDEAVEKGFHAGTYCGSCGELLIDLPGVKEIEIAAESE